MGKRAERQIYRKENRLYPFFVLTAVELVFHAVFMTRFNMGDDAAFPHFLDDVGLIDWSKNFFMTWSSRVLINAVVVVVARLDIWVWRVLDVAMIVLFVCSVSKLTDTIDERGCNLVMVCAFLLYPFMHQATAGWIVTTVIYLWPLAAGAYACLLLKKAAAGVRVPWYSGAVYILAEALCCSMEQNSVVMAVLAGAVTVYCVWRRKRWKTPALMTAVAAANIAVHLLCPGNSARNAAAVAECYPDFPTLDIFEKINIGFSEIASRLCFGPDLVFLLLLLLVALCVWKTYRGRYAAIALIPLGVCLCVGFFPDVFTHIFPELKVFSGFSGFDFFGNNGVPYAGKLTADNYTSVISYIPLAVMTLCTLLTALGIYLSIPDRTLSLLVVLVYFCGIGSAVIMGFSPTVYASGARPYTVTYGCFMAVIMFIVKANWDFLRDVMAKYKYFLYAAVVLNLFVIAVQSLRVLEAYA